MKLIFTDTITSRLYEDLFKLKEDIHITRLESLEGVAEIIYALRNYDPATKDYDFMFGDSVMNQSQKAFKELFEIATCVINNNTAIIVVDMYNDWLYNIAEVIGDFFKEEWGIEPIYIRDVTDQKLLQEYDYFESAENLDFSSINQSSGLYAQILQQIVEHKPLRGMPSTYGVQVRSMFTNELV